jgi:hypothetical protein
MPLPTESGGRQRAERSGARRQAVRSMESVPGSPRLPDPPRRDGIDPVTQRVLDVADGLDELLAEAVKARTARAEEGTDGTAVCAWNHFENIPTFYNWNNRPR